MNTNLKHTAANIASALLAGAATIVMASPSAFAQDAYPSKPIRMIVPYAAGGPTDIVGRISGQKLTERIGQQLVVENRGGANGIIGMELGAKAPPDGYTVILGGAGVLGSNPAFYAKLPYDAQKDFAPIILLTAAPLMLTVHPSLGVKTVADLIKVARSRPGQLTYGSGGTGGVSHLAGELLDYMTGTKTVHVAYKGAGPAMIDLLGGQILFTYQSTVSAMPHVKASKLVSVAVTSAGRAKAFPDLPAIGETVQGYEVRAWYGLVAPARTPRAIITKLNQELNQVIQIPEVSQRFAADGGEAVGGPPEVFEKVIAQDIATWTRLAKQTGLKLQ